MNSRNPKIYLQVICLELLCLKLFQLPYSCNGGKVDWFLLKNIKSEKNTLINFSNVLPVFFPFFYFQVIDLNQSKVCPFQTDWTDYIYYIIAAEIAMFLLLIGKVTYDYWVFKTHGYLPWPASKMPKMPCDWVFET